MTVGPFDQTRAVKRFHASLEGPCLYDSKLAWLTASETQFDQDCEMIAVVLKERDECMNRLVVQLQQKETLIRERNQLLQERDNLLREVERLNDGLESIAKGGLQSRFAAALARKIWLGGKKT